MDLRRKDCYLILAEHERGTHFGKLGKEIGFKIIRPQDIPRTVEEIEDGARR